MNIAGLQKTTLVDFPGKIAATVFTRGCTFRCPFCHNPELVLPDRFIPLMDEEEILAFFEKRKHQLQGVCITGGEPTLQKDLPQFIHILKEMGYAIKLDTNGSIPEMLETLIKSGNLDYIAMDIKTTLEKYSSVAISNFKFQISNQLSNEQLENDKMNGKWKMENVRLMADIKKSINLIMSSDIDYEFRTTVCHPIHKVPDFEDIGKLIKGSKRYFIQNFVKSKHVDEHENFESFTDLELSEAKKIVEQYIKEVEIR